MRNPRLEFVLQVTEHPDQSISDHLQSTGNEYFITWVTTVWKNKIENTQESVCFIFIITWCTRSRAQIIGLVRAVRTVAISIAFCHTTEIGIQTKN